MRAIEVENCLIVFMVYFKFIALEPYNKFEQSYFFFRKGQRHQKSSISGIVQRESMILNLFLNLF